ncbi:hypothetical protein F7725_026469 [Dissostichus mawsoni]|uniref:Uncharacterized protein n=1 Tax=Dissostichus mawsoni TaxID=36200 RepID=A0A7J5X736_DISMA|nr:hypothetical protein F7725_026469 [Dissostichus mawsoni]
MIALKPILQAWLEEAEGAQREKMNKPDIFSGGEKKRKRTSIAAPEKRSLEAYFAVQPRPSSEKIAAIAEKLDLKKNVVRRILQDCCLPWFSMSLALVLNITLTALAFRLPAPQGMELAGGLQQQGRVIQGLRQGDKIIPAPLLVLRLTGERRDEKIKRGDGWEEARALNITCLHRAIKGALLTSTARLKHTTEAEGRIALGQVTELMVDFIKQLRANFTSRFEDYSIPKDIIAFVCDPLTVRPSGDFTSQAKQMIPSLDEAALEMELIDFQTSSLLSDKDF